MGSNIEYSPTVALANITNLILDFAPILISWFELSYLVFGLPLD
jgi:hypothetical protein